MSEKKTAETRKQKTCICDWDDCEELQNKCYEVLLFEHKWKSHHKEASYRNLRRFRLISNPTSSGKSDGVKIKNESFINRCFSVLNASEEVNKNDFYIALHHFSLQLLANVGSKGKLSKPESGKLMNSKKRCPIQ